MADDEEFVRKFVSIVLKEAGFRVFTASDGQDALDVSRRYPGMIDVLLTDIQMPRLGGHGLIEQICIDRPEIKIVSMSGFAEEPRLARGRPVDFLPKPFRSGDLLRLVGRLVHAP